MICEAVYYDSAQQAANEYTVTHCWIEKLGTLFVSW